jgi:hypothetical protein
MLLVAVAEAAPGRQVVRQHLPASALSAKPIGPMAAGAKLTLAIGLPLRNETELQTFLQQLYDPRSSNYHRYLTPEEFTARFGPSEEDYKAVKAFAAANGLEVPVDNGNRMLVEISGRVADIERAFHTTLRVYQHPTESRTFYAPEIDPSLDLNVLVLSIGGLNDYALPRPNLRTMQPANGQKTMPNAGSGPGGGYAGYDFRAVYAPDTSLTGTGQILGMVQFDGYSTNDIAYYESLAGLPSVTLSNVLLNGASGKPSGNGGEIETTLDIEMAVSMAPGLSKIILYEAPSGTPFEIILNRMAQDNVASQLGCSWFVLNGASNAVADQIFQQMNAQGQSFLNASGDSDAYTGLISFPCDNPYITQVGGTQLATTGPGGTRVSESAWNRNDGTGTGGGISTQYPIPAWQSGINMTACKGSTTMRNIPDVAMVAETVYVRVNGGDLSVGGTSCAAPLWAAFTALVNQQAVSLGQPRVGFLNPLLSTLTMQPVYPSIFYDITNGDNTSSSSPLNFFAVTNYDLCTGWGVPNGQSFINALEPAMTITLPANATEGNGILTGAGVIQLANTTSTNITVTLASDNTSKLTVPPTATVLAGHSSVAFDLNVPDNGLLDGTKKATVTAYVPGYGIRSASILVYDDESATLQVSLPPTVLEHQGTVQGTLICNPAPDVDVAVSLTSNNTNFLVPTPVVVPAGQTSAVFTATIVAGNQIGGPQSVTVTAHVQNWTDGTTNITIQNDIGLNLSVNLPGSAMENAGVIPNGGSVSIGGTLTTNLPVTLVSSNTSKLIVPSSLMILAGQLSNSFNLTLVNNSIPDGNQTVLVAASAPGFTNGIGSVVVIDDETPAQPSSPRPADMAASVPANTNLSWSIGPAGEFVQNGGFETGTFTNWFKENVGGGDWVVNDGTYNPPGPESAIPPYTGSYSVVSEQTNTGTHVLYQDVALPPTASSAVLSWVDRIRNYASDFTSNQYFHVEIRTTNNTLLQMAFTTTNGETLLNGWTNRMFDLSPYVGETVRIAFVEADSLNYFNVDLDNISVQVNSAAPGVSNDVYFGTSPTPGPTQFQGRTTNTSWPLPLLAPQTTYYWQIIAHKTGTNAGPVWQFTTAGVDHFVWSAIPHLQFTNAPIAVTITAQDALNRPVTNFIGPAVLSSVPANTVSPGTTDNFTNGAWTGIVFLQDRATNIVLTADDGAGHVTASNPFDVAPANMAAVVLIDPTDQQAFRWGTATFTVGADGTPYLFYQWYFNDTNLITGATNSSLTLTNLQMTNAGSYSVTVTNLYGPATSADAMLTVVPLDHFTWGAIPSPEFAKAPFAVTITAQDAANDTFTTFNGTVLLSSTNGVTIVPAVSGNFQQGVWTGTVTVNQAVSNLVMEANDGAGDVGFAPAIDVVNPPRLTIINQSGSLSVSWPEEPSGFILESSGTLLPANWVPVPDSSIQTNGQYIQSISTTGTNQFFRLHFSGP